MTLQEVWNQAERDITTIARRTGNSDELCYISMGHDTVEDAVKKPMGLGSVNYTDLIADDWYVS